MTTPPLFPGFDGLMTLSRREGVDIRPTLLRVLTDLYVQARAHSDDEERQFVELTSRLIDQVDDATRAAVRARLAIYPGTPADHRGKLGLKPARSAIMRVPVARRDSRAASRRPPPVKAAERGGIADGIESVDAAERRRRNQRDVFPRQRQRARVDPAQSAGHAAESFGANSRRPRQARAIETLEMAAFAADVENFTLELGETLILPARVAAQVVNDPGGEPLACAAKALDMPSAVFQRVLLFLNPEFGSSVNNVYRLSRLYDRLSERSALIMLAAWRGSTHGGHPRQIPARALRRRTPSRPLGAGADPPGGAARRGIVARTPTKVSEALRGASPAPDRENAALPCPRSRRSRHPDRTAFPWPAALRPRLPAPAAATSAAKIRSTGRLSS